MVYLKRNIKRKKPAVWRWLVYAVVLVGVLFFAVPRYLIYKANSIIESEIPDSTAAVSAPPSSMMMAAYNYLQVAKFFPAGESKGIEGQKFIMDYFFPLFKRDWEKLKFACVDNAISVLKSNPEICKDSVNAIALDRGWKQHPDSAALEDFRKSWDSYHKKYQKELSNYYRFRDGKHL